MGEISREMAEISREFSALRLPTRLRLARPEALLAWVAGLTLAAALACLGLVFAGYALARPLPLAILVCLAILAEQQSIRLTRTLEVSLATLVCIFAAVVLGPLAGATVGAAGMLVHLRRRDVQQPILRWASWTSIRFLATAAGGLSAVAILHAGARNFWTISAAVAGAFLADTVVDFALFPIAAIIRGTASFRELIGSAWTVSLASVPLHVPIVAVLVFSYEEISPWSVALFGVPAFAAQRLFLLYRTQQDAFEALGEANGRLESANLSFATALVATLDARDRYTAGHSTAVAIYARDIAKRMGLDEDQQKLIHLAGLVHDIGKVGLPAGLLEKPGALTLEERRDMERHAVIGEEILRNVEDYDEIAAVVRSHHERVDGTGYPDRLEEEAIPLLARIIAVADAYNAMTSDRPYRDAMPSRVARLRLAQAVESQFDTSVVAAFEAILATATEDYRLGRGEAFDLPSSLRASSESRERALQMFLPAEAAG